MRNQQGAAALRLRLSAALTDAGTVLAGDDVTVLSTLDYPPVAAALDNAVMRISRELASGEVGPVRVRELGLLLGQLNSTRRELHDYQLRAYAEVEAELDTLQHVGSVRELFDKAPAAVTRCCGLDEAGLWSIRGGEMNLVKLHCEDDDRRAEQITSELGRVPLQLHSQLLETEVMRRRSGILVLNAVNDPRVDPATNGRFGTTAFVAVPIMPQGKVIGIFHGGGYPGNRPVDAFDFDALSNFARGFGHVLERVVLRARIFRQRDHFQRMVVSGSDLAERLAREEIGVSVDDEPTADSPPPLPPESRIRSLLTPRELEVLELMAGGRTNGGIARELVVSVGTVKFHVKHILSKLNATNRAQAVSCYMRIAAVPRTGT